MILHDMPWTRWPGMDGLLVALRARDGDTRVVGGAVRDTLLRLPVADVDLATRLRPDAVVAALGAAGIKAVPTGLAHGTITAVIGGRPVEVTTLRRDIETDGRHAVVAYTDDWAQDAARRDFTINALYADPLSGAVFDHFGGLDDIAARRVRFIGDPLARIAEDHLRILRFFRFHARFATAAPDPEGLAACTRRANDLMALSRERIADELLKLLALDGPGPTIGLMQSAGILAPVIPEIVEDAGECLARVIAAEARHGIPADPLRRLAGILPPDPRIADDVAARLRMSKAARARIACIAARSDADTAQDPRALAYRHGPACALDRLLLSGGDVQDALAMLDGWTKPALPIGGGGLIARGLAAGPIVAITLRRIEDAWIDAGFPDDLAPILGAQLAFALASQKASAASGSSGLA